MKNPGNSRTKSHAGSCLVGRGLDLFSETVYFVLQGSFLQVSNGLEKMLIHTSLHVSGGAEC